MSSQLSLHGVSTDQQPSAFANNHAQIRNNLNETPRQPSHVFSIAFFDLDDTLIPTDWVRRAFGTTGRRRVPATAPPPPWYSSGLRRFLAAEAGLEPPPPPVTIAEALSPAAQAVVREELERLGGADFDERAAALVEAACRVFGVVVIVTNARSSAWLQIASSLFPRFKSQLRRFSVPILRAATTDGAPTSFGTPEEYFHYWTQLKKVQFGRVIASALQLLATVRGQQRCGPTPCSLATPMYSRPGATAAPAMEEEAFAVPNSPQVDPSSGAPVVTPSLLMSPRSHRREGQELESLLTANETSWMVPLEASSLSRILAHQIRRFLLHAHCASDPNLAARTHRTEMSQGPQVIDGPSPYVVPTGGLLDLICVGDSEFELCAARELAEMNSDIFRGCGLVKCRAGLPPDQFRDQLAHIQEAMRFVTDWREEEPSSKALGLRQFGTTVLAEYATRQTRFRTQVIGTATRKSYPRWFVAPNHVPRRHNIIIRPPSLLVPPPSSSASTAAGAAAAAMATVDRQQEAFVRQTAPQQCVATRQVIVPATAAGSAENKNTADLTGGSTFHFGGNHS